MITGILTYLCVSALIMTIKIHLDGDGFYSKQLNLARKKRNDFKEKLTKKVISPMIYKKEVDRYSDKATIRTSLFVNYLLSPVLSPLLLLTFILQILTDTILLIKYWR